ncbi:MAG: hypothetical protein AMXMBFR59_13760 [Rhodanobacteraceae bacterium]
MKKRGIVVGATANIRSLAIDEVARVTTAPDEIGDLRFPLGVDNPCEGLVCLDKSWHAIYYVLTRKTSADGSEIGDAVLGGNETGSDLGHGSARLLPADGLREFADALAVVDFDERFAEAPNDRPA